MTNYPADSDADHHESQPLNKQSSNGQGRRVGENAVADEVAFSGMFPDMKENQR